MSDTVAAQQKEALFTKEVLGAGLTQIRKANYAYKGIYFQAFSSLSTGLERIGKLCLMLDYYAQHGGRFPDFKYLKNDIGHNIELLYQRSLDVATRRHVSFSFFPELADPVHQSILKVLSAFAKSDRYSNINVLVNSNQRGDPIASWVEEVDKPLFERRVTQKKKDTINQNARTISQVMNGFASVRHIAEDGSAITDIEEASRLTGVQEAIAPYRQLYVMHVIRFWVELIWSLQYSAMEHGKQDIPFFSEIFAPFYNDDAYIRTRKTWDKV